MKKSTFQKKMNMARMPKVAPKKMGVVDTVKNIVSAPGKFIKKQWEKNEAFRNKNSTIEKYRQNSK